MSVVSINGGRQIGFISGVAVPNPETREEYLSICKRFLIKDDYIELLCAIMDTDLYSEAEDQIKRVVDSYYSFKN